MKHKGLVGSSWTGKNYIHGPRQHQPSKYTDFRTVNVGNGKKIILGKTKSGKWENQSTLTPKKGLKGK